MSMGTNPQVFHAGACARRRILLHSGGWLLALLLGTPMAVWSQGSASLVVDRNPVVAGQPFRLTFEFQDASVQFNTPPAIPGIRFLSGPSTSSSTQIVNGAMSSKRGYTYSAVASDVGLLRIPSLEFKSRQGLLRTEAINLQVVKAGSQASRANSPFEAVIEVDKRSVHIGEPVRVQFKIYNRMEAVDVRNYSFPELSGVWKETVEGEDPRWENTIVDGRRVQVATVRTDILYPTRTGTLEIAGFNVDAQQRINFFNSRPVSADARAVNIEVTPLPTPIPATSLGTFQDLTVSWRKEGDEQPKVNEAVNLVLEFRGKGNLPLIGAPEMDWPKDLEVFDPEIKDRITTDAQGQRGRRTQTYLVIPRSEGRFEIQLPELSYFDHALDRFVTLNSRPIVLDVLGNATAEGPAFGFNSKTDVTILTRDMRFIRTETELKPKTVPFYSSPFHMSLWALPPLLLLAGGAWQRRREREASDPGAMRRKKAKADLKRALAEARSGSGSLDALGHAAHAFLQGCLDIPLSDAGTERYRAALAPLGEETAAEWLDLLATLDRGRFAPGAPDATECAAQLERLASQLGKSTRRPGAGPVGKGMAILLLASGSVHAVMAAPDASGALATFQEGNTAYLEGDLETAIEKYEQVALSWTSFELEYNMGVAEYKSGRIGPSILHFERARRIRPSDDDLQANLLLARSAVVDRIEEMPEIALAPLWRELTAQHRLGAWTCGSLIAWALACMLLLLRMGIRDVSIRRLLVILSPTIGAVAIVLGFMSRETHMRSKADDGAVIMAPRIEVKSSPSEGPDASDLFILHEGTVVEVLGEQGNWLQIRLANGNTGWVQAPDLSAI